jgi:hypothetical protein
MDPINPPRELTPVVRIQRQRELIDTDELRMAAVSTLGVAPLCVRIVTHSDHARIAVPAHHDHATCPRCDRWWKGEVHTADFSNAQQRIEQALAERARRRLQAAGQ